MVHARALGQGFMRNDNVELSAHDSAHALVEERDGVAVISVLGLPQWNGVLPRADRAVLSRVPSGPG